MDPTKSASQVSAPARKEGEVALLLAAAEGARFQQPVQQEGAKSRPGHLLILRVLERGTTPLAPPGEEGGHGLQQRFFSLSVRGGSYATHVLHLPPLELPGDVGRSQELADQVVGPEEGVPEPLGEGQGPTMVLMLPTRPGGVALAARLRCHLAPRSGSGSIQRTNKRCFLLSTAMTPATATMTAATTRAAVTAAVTAT